MSPQILNFGMISTPFQLKKVALGPNTTLQTLKLQGNDIQTEGTLQTIGDHLKRNREEARKRFALEHPELQTHKLKKPEKEKKKKERRSKKSDGSRRRSDDDERRRRKGDDKTDKESSSSKPRRPSSKKPSNDTASLENANAFLEDRKKSIEDANKQTTTMKDKFKGLGLGGKKQTTLGDVGVVDEGITAGAKGGMKNNAAFV